MLDLGATAATDTKTAHEPTFIAHKFMLLYLLVGCLRALLCLRVRAIVTATLKCERLNLADAPEGGFAQDNTAKYNLII